MDKNSLIKNRIFVSDLIKKVLLSEMTVSDALKSFPKTDDKSIIASFYALAHIEADEDLRLDSNYKDEQDEYLIHLSSPSILIISYFFDIFVFFICFIFFLCIVCAHDCTSF